MRGRVCVVTGATRGIGRATALELSRRGATVVLVARDADRGEAALADVKRASPDGAGELFLADLSSQRSIRSLADALRARHDRLHVLVNNAGALFAERELTDDGLERTFATNHLAHYLLTRLLLDVMTASAPSRVVNVSSLAHYRGTIAFDDLQSERGYDRWRAYSQSKLANVLFTFELARRLEGSGVSANCLNPGVVATNFGKTQPAFFAFLYGIGSLFMKRPESGAKTSVYLASSPDLEGVTGRYFDDEKPKPPSREARDPAIARRLWDVSAALTGLDP